MSGSFRVVEQEEMQLWNDLRPIRSIMLFWGCWRFGGHYPDMISRVSLIICFPRCGQQPKARFTKNYATWKSLAGSQWSGKNRKRALIVKSTQLRSEVTSPCA